MNNIDRTSDNRDDVNTPIEGDTAIIEGVPQPLVEGPEGELLRVRVGAEVFSSTGDAVAVVEITNADTVGIRAGSPGRSIVVPASGIARVSPDGKRVDLYASTREIQELSGANQSGARHLEAQQPQTLARGFVAPAGTNLPTTSDVPTDTGQGATPPPNDR